MPRKYDDDDDDDNGAPEVRKKTLSGMDSMYVNTNFVVLILFSVCCNGLCFLPFILSLIATLTCTDKTAKSNAKICLIISGIISVLIIVGNVIRFAIAGAAGFGIK